MNRFVIINFLVGCLTLIVGEYNSVGNRILFNWAIVENNPTEYIIAYRLREPSVLYGMSILFRLMDKINITIWKPIYYSDEWIRRNRLLNVHPIKAVKLLKSFEVGSIVELLRRDIIFKQENYECLHLKPDTLIGFSFQGKFCPVAYSLSTLGLDSFTLVPERNMNNRNRALELNKAYNVSDIIMPYEFSIKLFLATGADMKDLNGKCPNNETVLIDKYDYQFGLYKWFQSFHHEHDDDHDHDGNHGSNANTVKQSETISWWAIIAIVIIIFVLIIIFIILSFTYKIRKKNKKSSNQQTMNTNKINNKYTLSIKTMPSQKTKTTRQSEVSNSSVWDAGLSMPDADNWMYTMPMSQSLETSNLKEIININDMNVTPKSIDSMQKSIHQSNPTGNSKEFNKAIIRIESSKKDLPAPQFDLYKTKF